MFAALNTSSSPGLALKSRRELVSTREVKPTDWIDSRIGEILPFQESAIRMETRYQVCGSFRGLQSYFSRVCFKNHPALQ